VRQCNSEAFQFLIQSRQHLGLIRVLHKLLSEAWRSKIEDAIGRFSVEKTAGIFFIVCVRQKNCLNEL
jgi:hypothetical protein